MTAGDDAWSKNSTVRQIHRAMAELFSSPRITDDKNLTPERCQYRCGGTTGGLDDVGGCSNERSITFMTSCGFAIIVAEHSTEPLAPMNGCFSVHAYFRRRD